jgi:F-type H+-transporting ATPase subunit epsilon
VLRASDIDEAKVKDAIEQAREKISKNSGDINDSAALIELAKATAQLRVVELTKGVSSRVKDKLK